MLKSEWKNFLFECENSLFRSYIKLRINFKQNIPLTFLGTEYSGYWIPNSAIKSGGTLWGVGLGVESSFESELLKHGYFVYGFEPEKNCFNISSDELRHTNSQIFNFGLWDKSGSFNYTGTNISLVNIFGLKEYSSEKLEIKSLWEVSHDLKLSKQSTPRILKMNIEGAEKQIIEKLAHEPLDFEIIIFQAEYVFHLGFWKMITKVKESMHLIKQLKTLETQGLQVVNFSRHQIVLLQNHE